MTPDDSAKKPQPAHSNRADIAAVPPHIEAAAEAAFRAEYPNRNCSGTRLRAEETERYVVAVHSPVDGLIPTPYFIYEVLRDSLVARHMSKDEREPYTIKNYK